MRLFQPSQFWTAVKGLRSLRFLAALALLFLSLEAVARLAPVLVGKQVHQRFLYSSRVCRPDCANKDKEITWITNERGARGDLYHGQRLQVAVIGTSTSAEVLLDQKQCWTEQLKAALGTGSVHVDNFARGGAEQQEARVILRRFGATGKRYDAILIMTHIGVSRKETERSTFHYWGQWDVEPHLLTSPGLLQKRLLKQVESERRVRRLVAALRAVVKKPAPPPLIIRLRSRSNRELIKAGKVKLIYVPPTEEDTASVKKETRELLELAVNAANKVYLITQPIAYDENQCPGVAEKWFRLYPVKGRPGCYKDNRSTAEFRRKGNAMMAKLARSLGVKVIDLDWYMRSMLKRRNDLFDDKWHFTPRGAEVAAEFVAKAIGPELSHAHRKGKTAGGLETRPRSRRGDVDGEP